MKPTSKIILIVSLCLASFTAASNEKTVRDTLKALFPGQTPENFTEAAFPGWFEVIKGTQILYISADGRYVMQGDIYDMKQEVNITEQARSQQRLAIMQTLNSQNMIVFKPKKTQYVMTVFTDIDCGYCRKMHNQIKTYLAAGIEIRYVLFPRSGANTESYFKAVSVWCSADRQASLTVAKQGIVLPNKTCKNPIKDNIQSADALGITGTPTLLFSSGKSIPGYLPPHQLVEVLKQDSQKQRL